MARKLQVIGNFPSGEIDSEKVKQIVETYLEENPPAPTITINGKAPDENGNFVIELIPDPGSGTPPAADGNNVVEF